MASTRPQSEFDWTTVGNAIREQRRRAGISLRELGRRIGVTPGFVSQLENGLAGPSVATLYAVAQELGVSIDSFFTPSEQPPAAAGADPVTVMRAQRRVSLKVNPGVEWQMLAADAAGMGEFREIVYEPGASSAPPGQLIRHIGNEYGYLLSGELEVQVEDELFLLRRGDSIAYDASLGHRLHNPGRRPMRALWLICAVSPGAGSMRCAVEG